MRATPDEVKEIDRLFEPRRTRYKENLLVLKGADLRELDILRLKKGIPAALLKNAGIPELSKREVDGLLVTFSKLERKAEANLYDELNEVIDPLQQEVLVHKWVNCYNLHIPIAAKYL